MDKVLLISEKTLKKYTLVNDNVDGAYILPTIQVVQEIQLDELLGPKLLNKICEIVRLGQVEAYPKYKMLLDDYITPWMAYQVSAQIQMSVNWKITNSGVIENQDDKKVRLDYSNSRALQEQYQKYADAYALKMRDFIIKNILDFREYTQLENFLTSNDPNLCGIYLDNYSNYRNYIGK